MLPLLKVVSALPARGSSWGQHQGAGRAAVWPREAWAVSTRGAVAGVISSRDGEHLCTASGQAALPAAGLAAQEHAHACVVQGGHVALLGQAGPVLAEQAVAAQLGLHRHRAPRADLAPDATGHLCAEWVWCMADALHVQGLLCALCTAQPVCLPGLQTWAVQPPEPPARQLLAGERALAAGLMPRLAGPPMCQTSWS